MSKRPFVRSSRSMFESLESRQLLSLVVDLRLPGGGKSASVSSVGQKVNLEVWAHVSGNDANQQNEGIQIAVGSLLSTNVNGGAANGTLAAQLVFPFTAPGASNGVQADLDGDGDLDVGTNTNTSENAGNFLFGRGDHMWISNGDVNTFANGGAEFKVATATFTVTSLKSGGTTNLTFRARDGLTGALWQEDGSTTYKNGDTGSYSGGSPVVISSGGVITQPGSISGILFSDANKNGTFDTGDTLLTNRKMFIDSNKNGAVDSGEPTAFTNASGRYTFSNLTAGTSYRIRRGDTPAGYAFSVPTAGFYDVTLSSGQSVSDKNFGVYQVTSTGGAGSIAGLLFSDNNKNGAFDTGDTRLSARKMFLDTNKNGKLDAGEVSTTTNSNGEFKFSNLAAGNYRIRRADTPAGYAFSVPTVGYYDLSLTSGQNVTGKNFGMISGTVATGGSIAGLLFSDNNKNGVFDTGDTRLSNRKMFIDSNKNGILDSGEKSVFTNSNGEYSFSGLAVGSYRIRRADTPSGYKFSTPSVGFYDISLTSGQNVTGKNFGMIPA